MRNYFDVVIIGGGLAGLTAATLLARKNKSVVVLEKSQAIGGRAITKEHDHFQMNLGPHALYKNGEAMKILRELGVKFSGGSPNGKFGFVLDGSRLHQLPVNLMSLLKTSLLSRSARWELLRFFWRLTGMKAQDSEPLHSWLAREFQHQSTRNFIKMIIRIATYTHAADRLSAGAALQQLQLAFSGNVLYLDGGWQTLVDGLRSAALSAGVEIRPQSRAVAVEFDSTVRQVRLANGDSLNARNVVIATDPEQTRELTGSKLQIKAESPVKMACLTVGLRRLPQPKRLLAFGLHEPLYFSVHSSWAKLTPKNGNALIHLGKYLEPGKEGDTEQDRRDLEDFLDLCQPGWDQELVTYGYLPNMKVTNAMVSAASNGMKGRQQVESTEVKGLYFCGDWVGNRGMLADASLASAHEAAFRILNAESQTYNTTYDPQESLQIA